MVHTSHRSGTAFLAASPLVLGLALLPACERGGGEEAATPDPMAPALQPEAPHPLDFNRELAELREATARFHDFEKAKDAGYDAAITPCWYHGELGGMGYHYADLDLMDGTVELLEPEALMYEPGPDGQLRLVGLEYLVPIEEWDGEGLPSLLGQEYARNDEAGLYALHVWIWRQNPSGLFADWNPKVSCEHASEAEDLS